MLTHPSIYLSVYLSVYVLVPIYLSLSLIYLSIYIYLPDHIHGFYCLILHLVSNSCAYCRSSSPIKHDQQTTCIDLPAGTPCFGTRPPPAGEPSQLGKPGGLISSARTQLRVRSTKASPRFEGLGSGDCFDMQKCSGSQLDTKCETCRSQLGSTLKTLPKVRMWYT